MQEEIGEERMKRERAQSRAGGGGDGVHMDAHHEANTAQHTLKQSELSCSL